MKPYGRHVIIATARIDWAEDISDEQGSLAAVLVDVIARHRGGKGEKKEKEKKQKPHREEKHGSSPLSPGTPTGVSTPNSGYTSGTETPLSVPNLPNPIPDPIPQPNPEQPRIVTTNSSLTNLVSTRPHSHDVLLFPDNLLIGNVTARNADLFYEMFLTSPPVLQEEGGDGVTHVPEMPPDSPFVVRVNPYEHAIMICSHKKRDKRCGIIAPLLKDEFERVLSDKDIVEGEGGAVVLMVSHIGGKFGVHVLLEACDWDGVCD